MDIDDRLEDVAMADATSTTEPSARRSNPPTSPSKRSKAKSKHKTNGASSHASSSRAGHDVSKPATPIVQPETTRTVIADIARTLGDVQRAADEKYNVAQFASRLVRLLS